MRRRHCSGNELWREMPCGGSPQVAARREPSGSSAFVPLFSQRWAGRLAPLRYKRRATF